MALSGASRRKQIPSSPFSNELEAFFEPDEFAAFRDMVADEFDLPNYSIIDTAETFRELIVLLEDELF